MSDLTGFKRLRQIVGWSGLALIVVTGASILLSYLRPWPALALYNYQSFPFHFGWIVGIILLVFITFWAARLFLFPWRRQGEGYYYSRGNTNRDAESILKERYAKGEITKEQFEQMMRDLKYNS